MAFTKKAISVTFGYAAKGTGTVELDGLRVALIAANVGGGTVGQLEMAIYGMTLSHMNAMTILPMEQGSYGNNTVTIVAGDVGGSMATVFTGTVATAYADAAGMPAVAFRVSAYALKIQDVMPAQATSAPGASDVAQVAQQIAQQMGVSLENGGVQAKISNLYLHGSALMQMRRLIQHAGAQWVTDLETPRIAIWPSGQARLLGPTLVSAATGLVGYPSFTSSGIKVTTLYNSSLRYGSPVMVQSDFTPACGSWVLAKVEHELESETPGGKWFTYFEATPAKQAEIIDMTET